MDSTIFIRSKRRLAAWLILPVLIAASAEFGSRTFYSIQQTFFLCKQTLDRVIPEMLREGERFDQFINRYAISTAGAASLEDTSIQMLNTAAEATGLKITAMNLMQERDENRKTVKVAVTLEGIGSCRTIVMFLQQIKIQDPLIYEERLTLTRTGESEDLFKVSAQLGRIYMEREGANP